MLTATPFWSEPSALGDKDIAMFRSILVRRTDDLDGRDQVSPAPRIEDPDLVLVVVSNAATSISTCEPE